MYDPLECPGGDACTCHDEAANLAIEIERLNRELAASAPPF